MSFQHEFLLPPHIQLLTRGFCVIIGTKTFLPLHNRMAVRWVQKETRENGSQQFHRTALCHTSSLQRDCLWKMQRCELY